MTTETIDLSQDTSNEDLMPMRQPEQRAVGQALEPSDIRVPTTAAQAKVDAVAHLTMSAYEKASTLNLSDKEIAALSEDFPDEAFLPGAAGKENLIYCQHSYLRERLNKVFRPGQWSIVPRNRWAEDFKTAKGQPASRVYVEAMLVIRGCFVAEAVGEMEYYPHNAGQNYGDAVEGAKTAALRRCCKELGIGLQAWRKEWCEAWWSRKRGHSTPPPASSTHQNAPKAPTPPPEAQSAFQTNLSRSGTEQATGNTAPRSGPTDKPSGSASAPFPTAKTRAWLIEKLQSNPGSPSRDMVTDFFVKAGVILESEALEDMPLRWCANSEPQIRLLAGAITAFEAGERAGMPYNPHDEPEPAPKAKPAPKKAIDVDVPSVTGKIQAVSLKEGTTTRGAWSRFGIKVNDEWYSTFNKHLGMFAQRNKGVEVQIQYAEGKMGKDCVDIIFQGASVLDEAEKEQLGTVADKNKTPF